MRRKRRGRGSGVKSGGRELREGNGNRLVVIAAASSEAVHPSKTLPVDLGCRWCCFGSDSLEGRGVLSGEGGGGQLVRIWGGKAGVK